MGIFTVKECCEAVVVQERKGWEEVIFRVAKRAGIDTTKLSAGEVLTKMANKIIELRQELAYWDWSPK